MEWCEILVSCASSAPLLITSSRSLGTNTHPSCQVRNCARTWASPHAAPQTTAARREHDLTRGRADARAQSNPLAPGRWSESTDLSPQPHPTGQHPQSTGSDAQTPSRRDLTQGRTRTSLAPIVEIVSPHNLDWLTTPASPAATLRVHCPPHSTTLLRTPRPVPHSPIVAPSQSTLAFGLSLTNPSLPCHNAILLHSTIHPLNPSLLAALDFASVSDRHRTAPGQQQTRLAVCSG